MTTYNIPQLAAIWRRNGGSSAHQVDAVAVSLAESGGRSNAISPSADWGLWQINRTNFGALGVNEADILDPDVNAKCAIRMSGNGTNWAAWCTCWTNPGRDCGHGHIAHPQAGSPAGNQMQRAASGLGVSIDWSKVLVPAAESAPGVPAVHSAWGGFQDFVGGYARWHYKAVIVTRGLIRGA